MSRRIGFLSLLLLVAVAVSACGGVAAAPAALEDGSESDSVAQDNRSDAGMEKDDSDRAAMEAGSGDLMKKDSSDAPMVDDKSEDVMNDNDSDRATMDDKSNDMLKDDDSDGAMAEDGAEDAMTRATPAVDQEAAMDYPAWFSAELVNASTGESFRVIDFEGKVVLVETMAIWCSNCLRQQKEVKVLHERWGEREDLVTLVLDVDPNENVADLSAYAARNGFSWLYAVAPREVAREIGQLYGDQFLNPPSTPMLIIDRDGEAHPLPFGRKSAESLQESLSAFLGDGS
jgi:hypothetical protein